MENKTPKTLPPKRANKEKSLNFMFEELSNVARQQAKLLDLVGEAAEVRKLVKEKDPVIQGSERPTDDSEQHTRMEDVLISGLETKHRSDASAAAAAGEKDAEDAAQVELQSLERQLFNFLKRHKHFRPRPQCSCFHQREDQ